MCKIFSNPSRWRRRATQQVEQLETSQAQGLATLLRRLNRAQKQGDVRALESISHELDRFLKATEDTDAIQARIEEQLQPERVLNALQPAERLLPPLPATSPTCRQGESPSGTVFDYEEARRTPPTNIYWISSSTLSEAFRYLTQSGTLHGESEPEWMLAVTGLRLGTVRTLEHLVEVQISSQSFSQAAFDMADFTRIAIKLHDHGMALHAIFHSHRFNGPPSPSSTDDHLQETLEQGGYPAIQAVFSEDGYVRFFAQQRPFEVKVFGKGVDVINEDKNLYRIIHFSTLPHPALAADNRGADSLRSLPASTRR